MCSPAIKQLAAVISITYRDSHPPHPVVVFIPAPPSPPLLLLPSSFLSSIISTTIYYLLLQSTQVFIDFHHKNLPCNVIPPALTPLPGGLVSILHYTRWKSCNVFGWTLSMIRYLR
ncbi:uncharacterized protein BO88DRAFT_134780 [Aspergillus vadensis CBS 113365]|uniref:Uncharacterized protein n=1 Tax=Aspergillus vadensis (strain CBS 113365 / IMI 142717 / IBT 24658) TaxID=1448311 RepID=A0A319AZM9_ASPVC|nr:hypothetical protein BO88DRAFT_134780 [Aspergillus vadensis CBS 113365]PYH65649.1 hypothetical protein BO88DRAFT_134780 [Aspergillus vadensis CBS 113365]